MQTEFSKWYSQMFHGYDTTLGTQILKLSTGILDSFWDAGIFFLVVLCYTRVSCFLFVCLVALLSLHRLKVQKDISAAM